MKILVTGAGGFVGGHLTKLLMEHGHYVCSLGQGSPHNMPKDMHMEVDILDKDKVIDAMVQFNPEVVFHLAALSNVPYCWREPEKAVAVNVCGMIHVLEAFARVREGGRFVSIGSSDAYGIAANTGRPLTEEDICLPQNPYAVSKLCAEQLSMQLGKKLGIKVIHTRSFNHYGPGQALGFVVSDFACQVAQIEIGKKTPVISVGDLSVARDFTYVKDVIAAYASLIENDAPSGIYNICSGKAITIQQVLDNLLALSKVHVEVSKDPARDRPAEVPFFVGNNCKIRKAVGWQPEVSFLEGIEKTLEYWRAVASSTR